uniref:Very-long-chain 3-oxoacyl-CoA synthase n=1 Tax=Romanomermis culicivorax TaxID=13658 RepID=A0A915I8Z5_ROMCU
MMALNGNGTVYCAIYAGVPVPTVVVVPLSTVPCSVLGLFLVIILSKIMLQVSGSIPYRVKCLVLNLAFVDLLRNMYFIYKAMHQILSLLVGLQHLKVPFGWCIVEQWFLSVQISTTIMYLIVYYNNSKKLEKYHIQSCSSTGSQTKTKFDKSR